MKAAQPLIQKILTGEPAVINFIGDSVTHGEAHCLPEETIVAKLAARLARTFPEVTVYRYDGIFGDEMGSLAGFNGPILVHAGSGRGTVTVIRNGVPGSTVRRAINRFGDLTGTLPGGRKADLSLLMFGINDALRSDPRKYVSAEVFQQDYSELLTRIQRCDPETQLVLLTATTNDQTIDAHCEKTAELAEKMQLPLIDLHRFWLRQYRSDADNYGYGDWLAGNGDACHPTPIASEKTADYIFDCLFG